MRLALGLSYNGAHYCGWQSQASGHAVQDQLERALSQFANQPMGVMCTGRTDAGVHALMQVVHFDTNVTRPPGAWVRGPNSLLPHDIAVQWAQEVPSTFHARSSALSRRYVYVLLESAVRPSIEATRVGWVFRPLHAAQAMEQAAQHLLGEHDFSSFRAAQCQALSPIKTIQRIAITRRGPYWRFEFEANSFLHHMIRNIMACLIAVGQGFKPAQWMQDVLAARRRDAAAPTFAPDGLYFLGPRYAPHWGLPESCPSYDWLP